MIWFRFNRQIFELDSCITGIQNSILKSKENAYALREEILEANQVNVFDIIKAEVLLKFLIDKVKDDGTVMINLNSRQLKNVENTSSVKIIIR